MGHGKKTLDFDGNPDHVTLGLEWVRGTIRWGQHLQHWLYSAWLLYNSNSSGIVGYMYSTECHSSL